MMSLDERRTLIASALGAYAPGVTGYRSMPRAPKSFDGWPSWQGGVAVDTGSYAKAFTQQWTVFILLPPDLEAADAWISAHVDEVIDALAPALSVTGYAPAEVSPSGTQATYPALMINGESE